MRQIWKRDISRNVYQPKLIFVQKWWLIQTGISSPGHLWNINCVSIEFETTTFIWEWKMFSSGKEVFIFGSGFSLCVQLLECSGNTLVTQNSITWYCSSLCSHFLIPVIPQECSTESALGPHQILNLKFPNKRRKHLRKTTFQISSIFLKHNFSSKLFKLKGGTSEQSELL